jgi:hypothetical protein
MDMAPPVALILSCVGVLRDYVGVSSFFLTCAVFYKISVRLKWSGNVADLDYQYERAIHLGVHQISDIYQVILGNKVANLGKSYM